MEVVLSIIDSKTVTQARKLENTKKDLTFMAKMYLSFSSDLM